MPACPLCGKSYDGELAYCPECRGGGKKTDAGATPELAGQQEAWRQEVQKLVQAGNKIAAIKLYRERTGAGLAEAKQAVESGEAAPATKVEPELEARLLTLLRESGKLEAIRLYRAEMRCDLKAAKELVDELARRHGIESKGGCAGVALAAFLFICGAAAIAGWR